MPSPTAAVVLSAMAPGLGHLYCGSLWDAGKFFAAFWLSIAVIPIAFLLGAAVESWFLLVGALTLVLPFGVWLYTMKSAYEAAKAAS
jgi:hypothetical protein